MPGVGLEALDAFLNGELPSRPSLSIPFCRYANSRPRLGAADDGLIYDVLTAQLLQWDKNRWFDKNYAPVRTLPFAQTDPSFSSVPRMGAPVTCNPGVWAGFPAPTFTYAWAVEGVIYYGNNTAQFGMNADELAFMKQGREIRCRVAAYQEAATQGDPTYFGYTEATGYIRPALSA